MAAPQYGHHHQQVRKRMAASLPLPCSFCGQLITTAGQLHVDHHPPLHTMPAGKWTGELRPAHATCNTRSGAAAGNRARRAKRRYRNRSY